MAANEDENFLAAAIRHAAVGRRIVAQQRERVAQLKATGRPAMDAENTLTLFLGTLEIFEQHERELLDTVSRPFASR